MAGLQRSTTSFRRQGSSGIVWDDKLLSTLSNDAQADGKLSGPRNKRGIEQSPAPIILSRSGTGSIQRSRSIGGGGGGFRSRRVSTDIEPPSPRVSACGFCGVFAKQEKVRRRSKIPAGKRRI
ncbi:unnamed protein product [Cuscuta campestris]|uniref:MAPK kinase substrate protein n=1 Tax=Cuscuta campestris TaxID=132261 RepID=A0A484MH80_9ASTE|nr:unnamed protein product [Cuscuta campestris]